MFGRASQRIQKFKLRCTSGGDNAGTSLIAQRPPKRARGMLGCRRPKECLSARISTLNCNTGFIPSSFPDSCLRATRIVHFGSIDCFHRDRLELRCSLGTGYAREVVRQHPVRQQQRLPKPLVRFLVAA